MPLLDWYRGKLQNYGLIGYEAELLISWRNGLGLPVPFFDLDADVAATILMLQSELQAEGLI